MQNLSLIRFRIIFYNHVAGGSGNATEVFNAFLDEMTYNSAKFCILHIGLKCPNGCLILCHGNV